MAFLLNFHHRMFTNKFSFTVLLLFWHSFSASLTHKFLNSHHDMFPIFFALVWFFCSPFGILFSAFATELTNSCPFGIQLSNSCPFGILASKMRAIFTSSAPLSFNLTAATDTLCSSQKETVFFGKSKVPSN